MPSMSESAMQQRELFGGAIELHIPQRFADISDFRPVPDHQEVFADGAEDQSLIVEIVEYSSDVSDDRAGSYYFADQATANEANFAQLESVQTLSPSDIPGMTNDRVAYACLSSGRMGVIKGRSHQHQQQQQASAPAAVADGDDVSNLVHVMVAAIRLPGVGSELLITLNTPMMISPGSASAEHAGAGVKQGHVAAPALMAAVLRTLSVHDWSLFG